MLQLLGRASLSEFLGDLVVYRNLAPVDARVPDLVAVLRKLKLDDTGVPRKTEPRYAEVVAEMLRSAHRLGGGNGRLTGLVVVGDTEHNDGTAFRNLCHALGCTGAAFIGNETDATPELEDVADGSEGTLCRANRWGLLDRFNQRLAALGIEVGPSTAVVIDIDKTALGARGRNHRPIDEARSAAVLKTVMGVLGDSVDRGLVVCAYSHFNQSAFHPFTTDNQDYLAYICLLVAARWIDLGDLTDLIDSGVLTTFADLLETVDDLAPGLDDVHRTVAAAVAAGDPTPFKDFRRAEYEETVARMNAPDSSDDLTSVLESCLTITQEVREAALDWRRRGALLLGLSDKPDEASMPTDELASRGYLPVHRTPAWVVGEG